MTHLSPIGVPRELRRSALWLFLATLLAVASVHHPAAGWNVNTRLNLILAVVHKGTFAIDSWHDVPPHETMDKAFYEGHFYSDKTFGVSLLALPPAWLLTRGDAPLPIHMLHYVLRVWAVGLPAAASVALLYLILARMGAPPRRALFAASAGCLGSMWFGYATLFMPYAPGIACLLAALHIVLWPSRERLEQRECAAIGFLLGYALLCDLVFNIAVAGVGVLALLRLLDQAGFAGLRSFAEMRGESTPPGRAARLAFVMALFFAAPPGLFAAYCHHIFGTLSLPYQFEVLDEFREGMARGIMGVGTPDLSALLHIMVHPYRGLFFWTPMFLVGAVGCALGTRSMGKRRLLGWTGLAMLGGYLLFNAGYYMWWGGWAMGPRFMLPAVPFLVMGVGEFLRAPSEMKGAPQPTWAEVHGWRITLVAGLIGVALSMPVSLVDPQVPGPSPSQEVRITQFEFLRRFYALQVTTLVPDRLEGKVLTASKPRALASLLLSVGLPLGLLVLGWRAAPEKSPFARVGFPLRTVDGSLRPQPG